MKWFPRWHTAKQVGTELLCGLRDGSIELGAERWARLEAVVPAAAEVRQELVRVQESASARVDRLMRSVWRDYLCVCVTGLIAVGLVLGSASLDPFWAGFMCASGFLTGVATGVLFRLRWHDHEKGTAMKRWLVALQNYLDCPAPETERALRDEAARAEVVWGSPPKELALLDGVASALSRVPQPWPSFPYPTTP